MTTQAIDRTEAPPFPSAPPLPLPPPGLLEAPPPPVGAWPGAWIPPGTDPDTFVSPDPPPMPDAMTQEPLFTDLMSTLRRFLLRYADCLISGDSFLYYDRNDLNRRYEPDCYVAFGVDVAAVFPRNGYMVWIAGKPPDFALEIASESTWHRDAGIKRRDYARIGIVEYWRFDAEGRYHGTPLAGDRLVNGEYAPIPLERRADGSIWGYSAVLGLYLCWDSGRLYFWNPVTGTFLRNIDAAEEALTATQDQLDASQEELAATREQLAATQDRLAAVSSGKQNALDRLADAQEIIRRLQQQIEEAQSGPTGSTEPGEPTEPNGEED